MQGVCVCMCVCVCVCVCVKCRFIPYAGSLNVKHRLKNQNNQRPNVEKNLKTRKRVPDSFSKKPKTQNRLVAATKPMTKSPKPSNQCPYQFDSPPEIKQENYQEKGLPLSTQDGYQVKIMLKIFVIVFIVMVINLQVNLVEDDDIITGIPQTNNVDIVHQVL